MLTSFGRGIGTSLDDGVSVVIRSRDEGLTRLARFGYAKALTELGVPPILPPVMQIWKLTAFTPHFILELYW